MVEDLVRYHIAEQATHKLMARMHMVTPCGRTRHGKHWQCCIDLCESFGWASWEHWERVVHEHEALERERFEAIIKNQG